MPTFYEKLCAYDESKEVLKEIEEIKKTLSNWDFDERIRLQELEQKLYYLIEIVG